MGANSCASAQVPDAQREQHSCAYPAEAPQSTAPDGPTPLPVAAQQLGDSQVELQRCSCKKEATVACTTSTVHTHQHGQSVSSSGFIKTLERGNEVETRGQPEWWGLPSVCRSLCLDERMLLERHSNPWLVMFMMFSPWFTTLPYAVVVYGEFGFGRYHPLFTTLGVAEVLPQFIMLHCAMGLPPHKIWRSYRFCFAMALSVVTYSMPFLAPFVLEPVRPEYMPFGSKIAYTGMMFLATTWQCTQVRSRLGQAGRDAS